MFQAIQIETQPEQQGLAPLHVQRATGRSSRELALHRRKDALDQGAAPVELSRKRPPHLGPHATNAPSLLPALGGDHTLRPELLPDVGVIPLAVELGVGQHQPDARILRSGLDDRGQIRTVVPRTASRDLRQQELLIQIRHDHPLQPVPPRQRFLPVMMHAPHKERADRSLRQARGVHGHASSPPAQRREPRSRRTVSPTARWMVWSSRRFRKRYKVAKSGTLPSPNVRRNSWCSLKRTSASRKVQSS